MTTSRPNRALRAVLGTTASAALLLGLAAPATAAPKGDSPRNAAAECAGRGVPVSKVSIQLFTFSGFIGGGAGAQDRLRTVLADLADLGYRNVEPYSLHGYTAEQFADLLQEYGLKASARHVNVGTPEAPVDITQVLEENRILGIKYFGSGGTPRTYTTEAQWTAYAEYLDALGEQARKAGQTLMVHNHNWEFTRLPSGTTGYDLLMEHTDRRNVVFQLDVYWAAFAGLDPATLVERYGNRVQLLHVKDLDEALNRRIEIVSRGDLDFPSIFEAGGGSTRYFVVEHDPRRINGVLDPTFDPFEAAEVGFEYLDCVTF